MTTQYTDSLRWNNTDYIISDCEQGKLIYDSFEFKPEPTPGFNSALHRGHREQYEIRDSVLYGCSVIDNWKRVGDTWEHELLLTEMHIIRYTGACVICSPQKRYSDMDYLCGYLRGVSAFELHFTEGKLDEWISLEKALDEYRLYEEKVDKTNLPSTKYSCIEAIAFHWLKYKYDPVHSMYWRNEEPYEVIPGFVMTEEYREKKRKELSEIYEKLLPLMYPDRKL